MFTAVNASIFRDMPTAEAQVRAAAQAGFAGVELVAGTEGPLPLDASDEQRGGWRRLMVAARAIVADDRVYDLPEEMQAG